MKKLTILSIVLGSMALTGCVDNNYDLSSINTDARININDLVVPLNMDVVTLKSVLDLKETSKIKVIEIGGDSVYAMIEDGEFKSAPIKVPSFKTVAPNINPISGDLERIDAASIKTREGNDADTWKLAHYDLSELSKEVSKFNVLAKNIHEAVLSFEHADVDATFGVRLDVSDLSKYVKTVHFENVKIQLLKGVKVGELKVQGNTFGENCYDTETGVLDLSGLTDLEINDGIFSLDLVISGLDPRVAGINFDAEAHTLQFQGECKILSGEVSIYFSDLFNAGQAKLRAGHKSTQNIEDLLPKQIHFDSDFDLSEIEMNTFTGKFKYEIKDININPVTLTDIPDILNQDSTNIRLKNPQIYLTINNPIFDEYSVEAKAGLRLTSNKGNAHKTYEPETEMVINESIEQFLLSPDTLSLVDKSKYSEWVPFEDLGDILSGSGLPESIGIEVVDPRAEEQDVTRFRLGENLDPVTGGYELIVPLELADGSQIVYADSLNEWNDEDLDCLTIEKLGMTMNVTSDVALDMQLTVYPMVIENGKSVKKTKGVTTTSAHIPASAKGTAVEAFVDGIIEHLDGVVIEAKAIGVKESKVLSPDTGVKLNNLKVILSGYYEKEL